jgi:hypothetical protein
MKLVCPFCHAENNAASDSMENLGKVFERPEENDFALCVHCGEWSVLHRGNLRMPTFEEHKEILAHPYAVRMRAGWHKIDEDWKTHGVPAVEAMWLDFRKTVLHSVNNPRALHTCQMSFFAGAKALLHLLKTTAGEASKGSSTEEVLGYFDAIQTELTMFFDDEVQRAKGKDR